MDLFQRWRGELGRNPTLLIQIECVEEILDLLKKSIQESKQSKEERLALFYFIRQKVSKVLRALDMYWPLLVVTQRASHTICHSVQLTSTLLDKEGYVKRNGE